MEAVTTEIRSSAIPRPEYPRPDWERRDWSNLNGVWSFRFDDANEGISQQWFNGNVEFDASLTVPFSWTSPLSGIGDDRKGIGWYSRTEKWKPLHDGDRIFLRFGAVDYSCDAWVNGQHVGAHTGGYGTFEFDVTDVWNEDGDNLIVVRAEDNDHDYQTRGKQGYGESRGIWQPVWLEARPGQFIKQAKFQTKLDGTVSVNGAVQAAQAGKAQLLFSFAEGTVSHAVELELEQGENSFHTSFTVADPQLWSPNSPHLYEGTLLLSGTAGDDVVYTYFGIREIGSAKFGSRDYRWVTLNGKPVYLNGTLDQSFHQTGFFTYPSDEEMRGEMVLLKRLGLNFVRIHIKPEEPRKLYWADKLGVLVMEDMGCFWGEPNEQARQAYEREAQEVIARDCNHPSIFSWVMFNETWGLFSGGAATSLTGGGEGSVRSFTPETQEWVKSVYRWAKQEDPTRLVEDNSPCNYDHVESDLNTWHFYVNGYEPVRDHVSHVVDNTYEGSTFNYIGGHKQSDAPLMNSECGNVWGIQGSAGDSDIAWHYKYMLNEFRRHDKMCGFVFTEFRDVINEFNGYYRLDGTDKEFGYGWYVPGMTIADLHSPDYIVIDAAPCQTADAGAEVQIPLLRSSYSDRYHGSTLTLEWELWHDHLGHREVSGRGQSEITWEGYGVSPLDTLTVKLPQQDALAVLAIRLIAPDGEVITRTFTTFDVRGEGKWRVDGGGTVSVPVTNAVASEWPYQWTAVQDGKWSGGPEGRRVYEIALPDAGEQADISHVELFFEASATRLLLRHTEGSELKQHDISYMHGAKVDTERNPNTYYMTDEEKHPAKLDVLIDGERIDSIVLTDAPADSRGALSWHYQPVHDLIDEGGTYGYLCHVKLPGRLAAKLDATRKFTLELQSQENGLSLFGRNAGRYPLDILVRYSS